MLDQETIQKILGIEEKVYTKPEEMANNMNITFFPFEEKNVSENILNFYKKLKKVFEELHVNIVPYDESLAVVPFLKIIITIFKVLVSNILYFVRWLLNKPQKGHYFSFGVIKYLFKRTKIKKGISVVVLGEQKTEDLPMQFIYSFKDNSIISILDFPSNISEKSTFHEHFDTALNLFTYHMTNIVLGVTKDKWLLYNFNASHPIFSIDTNFKENVLHALVPKIVAPIRPYKISEFIISKDHFDAHDIEHKSQVDDLVSGALLFSKTSLYPDGKKIDQLPFRNDFYRWIGKLHLDNRNGMSYGFLAVQMPGKVNPLISEKDFAKKVGSLIDKTYYFIDNKLFIKIKIQNENYWLEIPDVWVLSEPDF